MTGAHGLPELPDGVKSHDSVVVCVNDYHCYGTHPAGTQLTVAASEWQQHHRTLSLVPPAPPPAPPPPPELPPGEDPALRPLAAALGWEEGEGSPLGFLETAVPDLARDYRTLSADHNALYDRHQELKQEAEQLREQITSAREESARLREEGARLQGELDAEKRVSHELRESLKRQAESFQAMEGLLQAVGKAPPPVEPAGAASPAAAAVAAAAKSAPKKG